MLKAFLILLLHCAVFQNLSAQTENEFHTDKKVGDTIITYGSDDGYEARLYIFMDEISCEFGFLSIEGILKTATRELNTQAVAFLKTRNQAFVDKAKSEYNIQFPVVHDIATAYQRLYGIKQFPLAILTDAQGKIYHIGVPGKTYFGIQEMKSAVAEIKKASLKKSELVGLKEIGALKIQTEDGEPLNSMALRMAEFFPKDNSYLLWDHKQKEAMLISEKGRITKTAKFGRFAPLYIPLLYSATSDISRVPFHDYGFDNKHTLYFADVLNDTLWKIDELASDEINSPGIENIRINDSLVAIRLRYSVSKDSEINRQRRTYRIYNLKDKTYKDVGQYDDIITKYPLSHHTWFSYCLDENQNFYQLQNFSDSIRVYTYTGEPIRTIACAFDSAYYNYKWKDYFAPLQENSPQGEFMQFADSLTYVSGSQGLLYDAEQKNIYVNYYKKKYSSSGNFYLKNYLHSPENKALKSRDIELPYDAKPFRVIDGIVYCTETRNGNLYITQYKLN